MAIVRPPDPLIAQLLAGLAVPLLVYALFVRLVWAAATGYDVNLWWLAVWFGAIPVYNAIAVRGRVDLAGLLLEVAIVPRLLYDLVRLYWSYSSLIKSYISTNQQWR